MGIMLCGNTRSGDTAVALDQGLSAEPPELLLQRFGNGFVRTSAPNKTLGDAPAVVAAALRFCKPIPTILADFAGPQVPRRPVETEFPHLPQPVGPDFRPRPGVLTKGLSFGMP